jgi:hypothetical protein
MEHNPSWEANSCSATQKTQKAKIHYHIHKNLPQVPIMSHMNSVHTL